MGVDPIVQEHCAQIMRMAHKRYHKTEKKRVSVDRINKKLAMSKSELRQALEILAEKGLLSLETIGGPWLYGHIKLTKKGVEYVQKIEKKKV